jgi:dephospho-CoA kinase
MLTRPFTRLVLSFGLRRVTQRQLVEEVVLGVWILVPLGFLVGLLTSRICTKIHFRAIRSDIWTTIVVFLVGDVLMEWLLPSLSCLPLPNPEADYHYGWSWLLQSYGMNCPLDYESSTTLLSPDATAVLFSLRLVFLCIGVNIGESLCFCALTGGIATGKSSVSRLLVEYNESPEPGTTTNTKNKRKPKRAALSSGVDNAAQTQADDYKDGTVTLICADKIAHQILLPPSVLANEEDEDDDDDLAEGESQKTEYLVHPNDSVYHQILAAFGDEEILDDEGRIDRLKLGALIFHDPQKRKQLNRITHPKIMMILWQRLLRGVFFGNCDLIVADIPLLFESGKLSWLFAVTICVTVSDPSIQMARLRRRNPELSQEECQSRIDSQMPLATKARMADIVIDNSGDFEELTKQVEILRRDLMGRVYGIGMSLLQMLLLIGGSTSIAVSSKFYSHWQQ